VYLVKKHLLLSGFEIFNASAGSGKTYQLTKSYLKLILKNTTAQKLGQILALTFTNKAVAEMKDRILDSLYVFANSNISKGDNALFQELATELGLSTQEMEKKSSMALRLLLHNYNFFEVSTIDKFTHRIIKTFAKELRISQNFEVELDADVLLDEAIGRLLQNSGDNGPLQEVLVAFSLEKIDANKSWNIIHDLKEIGKLLFKEDHYAHLQYVKNKSIQDFNLLKGFLAKEQQNEFDKASNLAQTALDTIYAQNFEYKDFTRETLPNHFKKIVAGERSAKLYANKLEEGLIQGSLLLKKVEKDGTQLFIKLLDLYLRIKKNVYGYLFFKNAYNNILPLMVLNEISKEILSIQKEKELLHISEFNKLISSEIAGQPVPYIYERLGERYRHYFIDEFQDTSKVQWHNLIPLIGNALETEDLNENKGTLLMVGDAKQSIYRWRGGDPKQFLDIGNKSYNPFTVNPQINTLGTNWRSFETIIAFNNDFFVHAANSLSEKKYQKLYLEQSQQEYRNRKEGYIEISFIPQAAENLNLRYCEGVLKAIKGILDRGFSFKDICILVRKNKHGVLLANYLAEHAIPLISSEALLLANNPEVQFLVSLLRLVDNPHENALQFDVLEHLFAHQNDKHNHIVQHLGNLGEFLKLKYNYDLTQESGKPLLHILEHAILVFQLSEKCGAHVIHFLDVVLEVGEKSGVSIYEFLKHWDLKKGTLAISAPQHQNAVQLMTVHKSKGLEFQFVIFPFANSKINDRTKTKKIWVPLLEDDESQFHEVLVNASKELEHYSEMSKNIYTTENYLSQLDDYNVLYVAMTRAIRGLFVLTQESGGETYGSLFKDYLIQKGLWHTDTLDYSFGHLKESEDKSLDMGGTTTIPYKKAEWAESISLAITSHSLWPSEGNESLLWGNVVHAILSEINSLEDIDKALASALAKGDITNETFGMIKDVIYNIVNHHQLSMYYHPEVVCRNEVELMAANGQLFRPDRLVFKDKRVTIIDYKTGAKHIKHKDQLETYASLLEELDLVVTEKILVYIGDKIEPVFI